MAMQTIYKGMENSASAIDANFKKIAEEHFVTLNTSEVIVGQTITLSESANNFKYIALVWTFYGNRITAVYGGAPNFDFRSTNTNLDDDLASPGWTMSEALGSVVSGTRVKINSSKSVDSAGKVEQKEVEMRLVSVIGIGRK